ncbi:hypothetical protein GA0115256_132317 [Streptomyces sp. DconLS]|nr:hypothetical protein GA0115256_132317 [Streptomyces sp. DconLS]SCF92201.1 hypothetical protein GA0115258_117570 [Streptomyces sp. LamerLS-31b]
MEGWSYSGCAEGAPSVRHADLPRFVRELLELPEAPSWGPFTNIQLTDGVLRQFAEPPVEIQMQHYAFVSGRVPETRRPTGRQI